MTASVLTQLSDALADAVGRAGAYTVRVDARRGIPASGVAWSADGFIVTADHVVERDEEITVGLPDGSEAPAKVVGRDPGSDLAVLKIERGSLAAAAHAPAGSVRVGSLALAVGRPGASPMASSGIIVAAGGPERTWRGGEVKGYVRTDATFYPGFSGGPLVDGEGRMIGLISSRLGRGAGIAILAPAVEEIAAQLRSQGRVKRAYLGIGSQPAKLPDALAALAGGQSSGLLLISVEPGTPAEQGGMLLGDILVRFAGGAVADTDDLQRLLGPDRVGQATPATVLRGGEPRELVVTPGERG